MANDQSPAPVAAAPAPELFAEHDTASLRRMHNALSTHIPGDATWAATVSRILQHLLSTSLASPARAERDKVLAEKQAAAAKAARDAALKARHKAEQDALPQRDGKPDPVAKEALDKKQHAEIEALAAEEKQVELAKQQAKERDEMAVKQREAQAALVPRPAPADGTDKGQFNPAAQPLPPPPSFFEPKPPADAPQL